MTHHWTDEAGEIANLARAADAIEIAGCREVEGAVERCGGEPASFYSVYFHFDPEWQEDPNELRGAMCIADRPTLREALDFADEQAARWSLPINNFAEGELHHDAHVRQMDDEVHRLLGPRWSRAECRQLWRDAARARTERCIAEGGSR